MLRRLMHNLLSKDPADKLRRLPVGLAEFNQLVDDAVALSGIPANDKNKTVMAGLILKFSPDIGYITLRQVAALLIKAAANQVAMQVINDGQSKPE